jgi:peptide/nickel transport system ATP-binding protein
MSLVVHDVGKTYPGRRRGAAAVVASDHVSFTIEPGAAVALVGQSGSGKSTLARMITGMERPDSGSVTFDGVRVDRLRRRELRAYRGKVQMVFQDPYAALNPLHTVRYVLTRPLINHNGLSERDAHARVDDLLATVGLTPVDQFAGKLPHQLSGGQRQRVVIARALAPRPALLVADEPVSMLDVSLRAGVLELLGELRRTTGISLLYITHDLLSARLVADRLLVLHEGRIVEQGPTVDVLRNPKDDYTRALLDALPTPF